MAKYVSKLGPLSMNIGCAVKFTLSFSAMFFLDPFGFGTDFFFFARKYDWMILVKLARDFWAPKKKV